MSLLSGRGRKKNPYCLARAGRKKKKPPTPTLAWSFQSAIPQPGNPVPVRSTLLAASSLPGIVLIYFSHGPRDLRGGGCPFSFFFFPCRALKLCKRGGEWKGGEGGGTDANLGRVPAGAQHPGHPVPSCRWPVTLAPSAAGRQICRASTCSTLSKGLGILLTFRGQQVLILLST